MKTFHLQRGQLLVAGIVLIVVIALMIAALGYLYVSGESAGTLHGQSERAYFAARSGIEYSSGQYFNGSACSSLNNAGVPVGGAGATASPGALGTMGADAMVVYAKGTALTGVGSNNNVYYRLWDAGLGDWGPEQTAQPVSATPVFIVVRFARTRNEAIMGVLDG